MTIPYNLRRKDYTNSLCTARLVLKLLCWFYAKEKNNYGKQKWKGESKTERG